MERLRLGSFSKGDHLTRRSMSHIMTAPTVAEAPTETPQAQTPRCVIVQRDERGYGLTVSGDNPVFVQDVRPGGAAARAGVQEGDQIQKVNGTLVTSYNHQEVVQLIRSGQYVALTLIGPPPGQHPTVQSARSFPSITRGTSFILVQGSLTPHQTRSAAGQKKDDARDRITGPQPVDADVMAQCNNTTLQTIQKMLSESVRQRQHLMTRMNDGAENTDRLRTDLENVQRTIDKLEKQMQQMRRSQASKATTTPPPGGLPSREATPDLAKQPPRRPKSSGTPGRTMTSSASMENIPLSPSQANTSSFSLSTPPRAHLLGNHQRQRSSPDSLIYRSPSEEGSTMGPWTPSPVTPTGGTASTGQLIVPDLVKPLPGEPADGGGAPNEAFEYDDDDSSPLLQSNIKPMANRPLPPLPQGGTTCCDPVESRASFEHQDSTESDAGLSLFSQDQSGFATLAEGGALFGLGESLLKGWKMLRQPVEVAMFLHYLLQNNMNPAPFLFCVIVEQYKSGKQQDMSKWAYEITSTFLAPNGPLCIDSTLEDDVLQTIDIYMRTVDKGQSVMESELRDIFVRARMAATAHLKPQLEEFQRDVESKTFDYHHGMTECDQGDTIRNWESILLTLCKSKFPLQDQVDSLPNQTSAMLAAIATVLKLTVVKSEAGLKTLEHIPTFVSKEKQRLKLFPPRPKKPVMIAILGHNFQGQHYNRVTDCSVCQDILWGVGDQGLQCSNCEMNIHKQCHKNVDEICVGEGTRGKKATRRPTTGSLFRKDDNDSTTELDKIPGGSGGSPLSTSRAPVGRSESFRQRRESRNALRKRSDPNIPRSKSDVDADDKPRIEKTVHSDSDMDCDDELPKWEDLVGFETVRQLKPKEKKRQDVLNELFHTERLHVRKLKILSSVYYEPLKKLLDQSLLDNLFPNLQELIQIHSELNQKMKFKRKQEPIVGNVGQIMLEFFTADGGSKLELAIATFCKDQTTALEELKAKQKKDPKLQQFLAEASMRKECAKLHLKEIIATTHQRLTKYPLLLDQVLRYTQPGEEYDQINMARESSKRILAKVNRTIGEIANQNRVRDVEKHLEIWPPKDKDTEDRFKDDKRTDDSGGKKKSPKKEVHPLFSDPTLSKHKLIYEGVLEWKLTKSKSIDITAMLFDDFLILLQKQDDKYHFRYHARESSEDTSAVKVSYPPVIDFPRQNWSKNIAIRDVATNKMGFFLVEISKSLIYEFVAHSVSDKNKWLDKIKHREQYLQEDTEPPLIFPPTATAVVDDSKEASKPIIRGQDEDRVYLISEEKPMQNYRDAVTEEPPLSQQLETAQPVITLPAQLQKIDDEIHRLLAEKAALIDEMMGSPTEHAPAEIAEVCEAARDPLGLIADIFTCTRELQAVINKGLSAPKPATGENVTIDKMLTVKCPNMPCIPVNNVLEPCQRLYGNCMALSQGIGLFDRKALLAGTRSQTNTEQVVSDQKGFHPGLFESPSVLVQHLNDNINETANTDAFFANMSSNNNPDESPGDSNNNEDIDSGGQQQQIEIPNPLPESTNGGE
ncbi:rho guanine nucleotide exchange factor 12-like [Tropilaelaps mercedesae]|uniref:Rho guanine nucleotide exchange factor 12-like n=1 Tax=Tropilaelaps mercedesae TaxID=418985 RepID=A0A1V9XRG9_9ACAR|nr:rho guanine nucleotide exchange factor 12-like [Tropilaelaps mercedesae]